IPHSHDYTTDLHFKIVSTGTDSVRESELLRAQSRLDARPRPPAHFARDGCGHRHREAVRQPRPPASWNRQPELHRSLTTVSWPALRSSPCGGQTRPVYRKRLVPRDFARREP